MCRLQCNVQRTYFTLFFTINTCICISGSSKLILVIVMNNSEIYTNLSSTKATLEKDLSQTKETLGKGDSVTTTSGPGLSTDIIITIVFSCIILFVIISAAIIITICARDRKKKKKRKLATTKTTPLTLLGDLTQTIATTVTAAPSIREKSKPRQKSREDRTPSPKSREKPKSKSKPRSKPRSKTKSKLRHKKQHGKEEHSRSSSDEEVITPKHAKKHKVHKHPKQVIPKSAKLLTFGAAKLTMAKATTPARHPGLAATQVAPATYAKMVVGDQFATAAAPPTAAIEFHAQAHDVQRKALIKEHRDIEDIVRIQHGGEDKKQKRRSQSEAYDITQNTRTDTYDNTQTKD